MATPDRRRYYPDPRAGNVVEPINPWAVRLPLLIIAGMILVFFAMVAATASYQYTYQDRVLPGVSTVYGADMTGMTEAEVRTELAQRFTYANDATFVLRYGDEAWEFTAADLGVSLDIDATVDAIFNAGRDSNTVNNLVDQWTIWRDGYAVAPIITYNQSVAEDMIRTIAAENIDQPMQDATITVSNGRAIAGPSQIGRTVDVPATLDVLRQQIVTLTPRAEISMYVVEEYPAIVDATEVTSVVNTILDERGVTFYIPSELGFTGGPWTATPESLANMLIIERVDNGDGTAYYSVSVTEDQAAEFLRSIAPELTIEPVNARFTFNDNTRQLELLDAGQNGRVLDVAGTLATFQTAVYSNTDRTIPLVFAEVLPDVNQFVTAEELGITEQVISTTTSFRGSTNARRTNVQVAAARFNGIIIPPQSEFSFNEYLGDVSTESGFEEGLIIYGNQTITGVGGGVCQVSTTVFQAAFWAGFPILERWPHGYRVSYYEQDGTGPGMDATVYSPIVDFRFMNDTDYHLLIETSTDLSNYTVTFRFYSTDTGRYVEKDGPYVRNVQPAPPPVYRATPGVTGTVQVDYAVSGAEVYVYRDVYDAQGNLIVDDEEFYSNYIPWPAQFQVPPGDPRAE